MNAEDLHRMIRWLRDRGDGTDAERLASDYKDDLERRDRNVPLQPRWNDREYLDRLFHSFLEDLAAKGQSPPTSTRFYPPLPATMTKTVCVMSTPRTLAPNGRPRQAKTDRIISKDDEPEQGGEFHSALMATMAQDPRLKDISGRTMGFMASLFQRTEMDLEKARDENAKQLGQGLLEPHRLISRQDQESNSRYVSLTMGSNPDHGRGLYALSETRSPFTANVMDFFLRILATETSGCALPCAFADIICRFDARINPSLEADCHADMRNVALAYNLTPTTAPGMRSIFVPWNSGSGWVLYLITLAPTPTVIQFSSLSPNNKAGIEFARFLLTFCRDFLTLQISSDPNRIQHRTINALPDSTSPRPVDVLSGAAILLSVTRWIYAREHFTFEDPLDEKLISDACQWILCVLREGKLGLLADRVVKAGGGTKI